MGTFLQSFCNDARLSELIQLVLFCHDKFQYMVFLFLLWYIFCLNKYCTIIDDISGSYFFQYQNSIKDTLPCPNKIKRTSYSSISIICIIPRYFKKYKYITSFSSCCICIDLIYHIFDTCPYRKVSKKFYNASMVSKRRLL